MTLIVVQKILFTLYLTSCRTIKDNLRFKKIKKIRKYWKNLKNEWKWSLAPSLPSRNKTLVLVVKN